MIPYGRQDISQEDIDAIVEVLRSDWLTQGPMIERFEQAMVDYTGARHAVAVCNATAALHLACRALGLGPGDILWTSPITFVASANCALYCGASVDFVDIDPVTYNMSVAGLEEKLEDAQRHERLPKIVVPVHFAGQSCPMRQIRALAERFGFAVIEDASHAIGGKYLGDSVGCCRYSDVTVFSFHPVKIITTGEGGMAFTNSANVAEKLRLLRTHGITREERLMESKSEGGWYYQQVDLGFNYRMTDIQAALGFSQLQRLETFVVRRRELAGRYDELLAELPVIQPSPHADADSAWHLYVIQLNKEKTFCIRHRVFDALRNSGIGVNVHYIPVHIQPYYRRLGFRHGDFPVSENYYKRCISLPLFPGLTSHEQDYTVVALRKSLEL